MKITSIIVYYFLIFFSYLNPSFSDNDLTKSEKLAILHDTLPHIPHETLEQYLEIYNGNIDKIVDELLNEM